MLPAAILALWMCSMFAQSEACTCPEKTLREHLCDADFGKIAFLCQHFAYQTRGPVLKLLGITGLPNSLRGNSDRHFKNTTSRVKTTLVPPTE